MPTKTIASILFLLLSVSLVAQPAPGRPDVPFLTVSGQGEVRIAPDQATVRLGVVHQASTAQAAQIEANRTANRILEAFRNLGIPERQIQTTRLQLHPVYASPQRPAEAEARIIGYRASHVVQVLVRDLAQVGPVVDAGLQAGANRIEGVDFGLQDEAAAQREALQQAVRKARDKAEAIAAALGVELVSILEVNEAGSMVVPVRAHFERAEVMMDATPIAPGEVTASASVSLRYHIR